MDKKNIRLIFIDLRDATDFSLGTSKDVIPLNSPETRLDLRRFEITVADGVEFYGAELDKDTDGNFDPIIAKVEQKYDPIHKIWVGLWDFDEATYYSERKARGEDYWDDAVKEFEKREYSKEEPEYIEFEKNRITPDQAKEYWENKKD